MKNSWGDRLGRRTTTIFMFLMSWDVFVAWSSFTSAHLQWMPEYEVIPGGGNVIHRRPLQIFVLLSDSFPSWLRKRRSRRSCSCGCSVAATQRPDEGRLGERRDTAMALPACLARFNTPQLWRSLRSVITPQRSTWRRGQTRLTTKAWCIITTLLPPLISWYEINLRWLLTGPRVITLL